MTKLGTNKERNTNHKEMAMSNQAQKITRTAQKINIRILAVAAFVVFPIVAYLMSSQTIGSTGYDVAAIATVLMMFGLPAVMLYVQNIRDRKLSELSER